MSEKYLKFLHLISAGHPLDRARALAEIRLNQLFVDRDRVALRAVSYREFVAQLEDRHCILREFLKTGGEAEEAVGRIRREFTEIAKGSLPFPAFYNADLTLALLSYALTRYLRPQLVLEMGVGYGITSALVLRAMERNGGGELVSVDLPSLADPTGSCVGLVVPEQLKKRWNLCIGSSRRWLPEILANDRQVSLFISDSANVYTLQRYEYEAVFPRLVSPSAALFNNIGAKFQGYINSVGGIKFHSIAQIEKAGCATGLIFKA